MTPAERALLLAVEKSDRAKAMRGKGTVWTYSLHDLIEAVEAEAAALTAPEKTDEALISRRRMTMVDLHELLARTLCEVQRVNSEKWCWNAQARAILAALDAAGLVVVPMLPTVSMCEAGMDYMPGCDPTDCMVQAGVAFEAMLAASPYAKKEVE